MRTASSEYCTGGTDAGTTRERHIESYIYWMPIKSRRRFCDRRSVGASQRIRSCSTRPTARFSVDTYLCRQAIFALPSDCSTRSHLVQRGRARKQSRGVLTSRRRVRRTPLRQGAASSTGSISIMPMPPPRTDRTYPTVTFDAGQRCSIAPIARHQPKALIQIQLEALYRERVVEIWTKHGSSC